MDFKKFAKSYLHQRQHVKNFLKKNYRPLATQALAIAEERHKNQKRLDGSKYIIHIYEVLYYLIIFRFDDDLTLAMGALHDTVEDEVMRLIEIINLLNRQIAIGVRHLSKKKGITRKEIDEYFEIIFQHFREMVIKLIDRLANMKRSMIGYFSEEQLRKYVDEGNNMIIPRLEGFIDLCEDPVKGCDLYLAYNQHTNRLRIIRGLLKGLIQAAEEHLELMGENRRLKKEIRKLLIQISKLNKAK